MNEVAAAERAAAQRAVHRQHGDAVPVGAVLELPPIARWSVSHEACAPGEGPFYDMPCPTNPMAMLEFGGRVLDKTWGRETDIHAVMLEAASATGRFAENTARHLRPA